MATNQFAINMTRLLTEEGVSSEHTSSYFGVKGLCYLNGVDEAFYSSFMLELGSRPLFSDFCAKWVTNAPWEFSQDVFSVTHTCIDGDWNKVLIHIDIRYVGDQRKKVRRRQFVSDITGYLLSQGLMTPGEGGSQHFEIYIGEDSDYGEPLSYFRGTNIPKRPGQMKSPLYTDENIGIWLETAESIFGEICPWVDWDEDMVTNEYVRYAPFGNTVNHFYDRDGFCYLNLVAPEERAIYDSYCGARPTLEIFLKYWNQEGANKDEIFALTWHTVMGSDTQYMIHVDRHFGGSDPRFKLRVNNMQVDLQRFVRVSGLFGELCNGNSDVRIGGKKLGPGCTGKMQCKCQVCKPATPNCLQCGSPLSRAEEAHGDDYCEYCAEFYTKAQLARHVDILKRSWHKKCHNYNQQTGANLDRLGWFKHLVSNNAYKQSREAVLTHDAALVVYNHLVKEAKAADDKRRSITAAVVKDVVVVPHQEEKEPGELKVLEPKPISSSPIIVPMLEEEPDLISSGMTTPLRVPSPTFGNLKFGDAPRVYNTFPERMDSPVPLHKGRSITIQELFQSDNLVKDNGVVVKRLERWVPPSADFDEEELGGVMDDSSEEIRHSAFSGSFASKILSMIQPLRTETGHSSFKPLPNWRERFGFGQGGVASFAEVVKGASKGFWHPIYDATLLLKKIGSKVVQKVSKCGQVRLAFNYKRTRKGARELKITLSTNPTQRQRRPPKPTPLENKLAEKYKANKFSVLKLYQPNTGTLSVGATINPSVKRLSSRLPKARAPLLVNTKYANWCEENLARKLLLKRSARQAQHKHNRLSTIIRRAIPETIGAQVNFLKTLTCNVKLSTSTWHSIYRYVKLNYNCPIKGSIWNLVSADGIVEINDWHGSGVSVCIDGNEFGHLGSEDKDLLDKRIKEAEAKVIELRKELNDFKRKRSASLTHLVDEKNRLTQETKLLLRQLARTGTSSEIQGISGARTSIFARYTNSMHWFAGYRLTMTLGFTNVHSRSLNFSREQSTRDNDLITNRQSHRFWSLNGCSLVFTMKGVSKMFFEKKPGSRWRQAIAKSLGLTVSAAERQLPAFLGDESVPDLVLHDERDEMVFVQKEIIKEVPVYIEKPSLCLSCSAKIDDSTRPTTAAETVKSRRSVQFKTDTPISETKQSPFMDPIQPTSPALDYDMQEHMMSSPFPPNYISPYVEDHQDARDSRMHDVELNPGPSSNGDELIKHTTPEMLSQYNKNAYHRRAASEVTLARLREEAKRARERSLSKPGDRSSSKVTLESRDGASDRLRRDASELRKELKAIVRSETPKGQTRDRSTESEPDFTFPNYFDQSQAPSPKIGSRASSKHQVASQKEPTRSATPSPMSLRQRSRSKIRQIATKARSKSRDAVDKVKEQVGGMKRQSRGVLSRLMDSPWYAASKPELKLDTQERGRSTHGYSATSATPSGMEEESKIHHARKLSLRRSISRVREAAADLASDAKRRASFIFSSRSASKEPDSILSQFERVVDYKPKHTIFDIGRHYKKYTAYRIPVSFNLTKQYPVRGISAGAFNQLQNSLNTVRSTGAPFESSHRHSLFKMILDYLVASLRVSPTPGTVHLTGSNFSAMAHTYKTTVACPNTEQAFAIDIRAKEKLLVFYEDSDAKECRGRLWWLMDGYATVHGGWTDEDLADWILRKTDGTGPIPSDKDVELWSRYSSMVFRHPLRTTFIDDIEHLPPSMQDHGAWTSDTIYDLALRRCEYIPPVVDIENYYWAAGTGLSFKPVSETPAGEYVGLIGGVSYREDTDAWPTNPKQWFPSRWHQKTKHRVKNFVKLRLDQNKWKHHRLEHKAFFMAARIYILIYLWFLDVTISTEFDEWKTKFTRKYFYPEFETMNTNIREVDTDESHPNTEERLLIAKMGTRGDQVPIDYVANVVASFGVPVDTLLYQNVTPEQLHNLRYGEMLPILPTYLEMMHIGRSRYKRVFVPQIEVEPDKGMSYTLAPSTKWINDPTFVTDWRKVKDFNKVFAFVATFCFQLFRPAMRIGALSDCHFPRSIDGLKPLRRMHNTRKGLEGWDSGSAGDQIIPDHIKSVCQRVPKGNHLEIFRDYDIVHTHGGAGTVQTIIAAGATPVIWDPTLDRDYHTIPTTNDIREHSISFLMGWVVASGFKVKAPFYIKCIWYLKYKMVTWKTALYNALWLVIKAYIMIQGFYKHHLYWLVIATSVPILLWRFVLKDRSIPQVLGYCAIMLWRHPLLFTLLSSPFTVLNYVLLQETWVELMQDVSNFLRPKKYVIFTPIASDDIPHVVPFPIGHYLLWDKVKDKYYEGRFRYNHKRTIDDPFKMVEIAKPNLPSDHRKFPAPWSEAALRDLLCEDYKPYGMTHNCATLVLRTVWYKSVVFSVGLMASIGLIAILFSPGKIVKNFFLYFKPHVPNETWEEMWIIKVLGFAAGNPSPIEPKSSAMPPEIEAIPLEDPENIPQDTEVELEPELPAEIRKAREDDIEFLMREIALIIEVIKQHRGIPEHDIVLDDDDLHEAAMNVLGEVLVKEQFPKDAMRRYESLPYAEPTTYEAIVDEIHFAISFLRNSRFIKAFINFFKSILNNIEHFIQPLLRSLAYIFSLAIKHSKQAADTLFIAVSKLIDKLWGLEQSKRVKTVWGLTGLYRTGVLGAKAQMDREVAFASFTGRSSFEEDYDRFISRIKEAMHHYSKEVDDDKLGGPQRRPIRYKRPFGNQEWAKILGFGEDEYDDTDEYEKRIMGYLAEGVHQGVDGVHYADLHPEKLQKSTDRYAPKYPELTSTERARARAIADTLFERYPDTFANANTSRPEAVMKYLKQKYSPGIPFIRPGGYKSREAMFKAGFDKAIKKLALDSFKSGIYPVKFYQSFGKSQVVDGKALLPIEDGGKDKNVRTIVAQDLFTMVQDQVFQLERNKRATWDTYGMGAGMPLNQSMAKIFEKMYDLKKQFGGHFLEIDATEFDSRLTAFSSELNARLWERGFENHHSGNGKAFASQLAASYSSKRDAWIIGITEPEYDSLTISIPDKHTRHFVESKFPERTIALAKLIDWRKYRTLDARNRLLYVQAIKPPPNKLLISWKPNFKPNRSNFMGQFEFGDIKEIDKLFFEQQTMRYAPGNWRGLLKDVEILTKCNYPLLSNVHPKDRGAGTGEGDTSLYNTHSFRGTVIDAVCETKDISPKEFWVEVDANSKIYKKEGGTETNNTSDDSITWSGGEHGLVTVKDIHTFQRKCKERGIWLKLTPRNKITDLEYLSKFVRPPTESDSIDLAMWRKTKIAYTLNREKQLGLPIRNEFPELNNPRFLVVQNPSAILLRRSAFRYYQSSLAKHKYISAERGAGHAMNTAFCPSLYDRFALEWCDDVNSILVQHKILAKYEFRKNFFSGLPGVARVDNRVTQQALSPRQKAILEWVKQNLFPSYYQVMNVHMNIGEAKREKHDNLLRKLNAGWRGWDQILREGVDWLFAVTDAIPDSWSKKFQPSIDMLYAEPTFYTHNCYTETFVYLKLLEEYTESEISFSMFNERLMESAYSGTCDPYSFWHKISNPEYRQSIIKNGHERYQGVVFMISLLYACTSLIEMYVIYQIPIVAQIYQLYMWTFIGLNKVYGLSNTMYWHATGKSSRIISRLMPRDPYIVSKRACAFAIDLLPADVGFLVYIPLRVLDLFPFMLEAFAKIWYLGIEIKNPETKTVNNDNPWLAYTPSYLQSLKESPTSAVYIDAKTSTGKSSYFVAAINHFKQQYGFKKIWVLEPTRILHANVSVPFQPNMQYLQKGVRLDPSADIYVATYGHARMGRISEIGPNDVVLFDEFHKLDGDILLALEQLKCYKFLLSATTVDISFLQGSPYFKVPIEQRHPTTIYQMEEQMDVVQMYSLAHQRHERLCDRALIIVPTKKMAQQAKEALSYKYKDFCEFTVVSKDQRVVPNTGCIIATPYVETGVDMKPPAKILIDSGLTVKIDKGKFVHPLPKTDKDSNTQRIGRVGRLQPGVVYQNPGSGEGPDTVTYPPTTFFQFKAVADHFKVPQLGLAMKPRSMDMPYLHVNTSKLNDIAIEKSVVLIHAFSAQGLRPMEWERKYNDIKTGVPLHEQEELLRRVIDSPLYRGIPLPAYADAQYHLNRYGVIGYEFLSGDIKWGLPMHPIDGKWYEVELEDKPHKTHTTLTNKWLKQHTDAIDRRQARLKSAVLKAAEGLPGSVFSKFRRDVEAL